MQRYLRSHHPDLDDLVELSVSLAGLTLSVRGSPERAAAFVHGFSCAGSSARSSPLLLLRAPTAPLCSCSARTRESIRRGFPAVPLDLLDLFSRLTCRIEIVPKRKIKPCLLQKLGRGEGTIVSNQAPMKRLKGCPVSERLQSCQSRSCQLYLISLLK